MTTDDRGGLSIPQHVIDVIEEVANVPTVSAVCAECGPSDYAPSGVVITASTNRGETLWAVARYFCPKCRRMCTSEYLTEADVHKLAMHDVVVKTLPVPDECREWPAEKVHAITIHDIALIRQQLSVLPSGDNGRSQQSR